MNLWSQGFWGAKFFWLKYPDHFFLYVVSAKDLTFCRLLFIFLGREQSQENSHLESFRTKVCYECGEMYAQTEDNADVFTKTTKIGEESEIVSGKKNRLYLFSDIFSQTTSEIWRFLRFSHWNQWPATDNTTPAISSIKKLLAIFAFHGWFHGGCCFDNHPWAWAADSTTLWHFWTRISAVNLSSWFPTPFENLKTMS